MVEKAYFNRELYGLLKATRLVILPLRRRTQDIWPLAYHFMNEDARRFARRIEGISEEAQRLLINHDWPGNVRELKDAIEGAMIVEPSPVVTTSSLKGFMWLT